MANPSQDHKARRTRPSAQHRAGGQAMIEFIVGLVAVLALFAGLLQVTSLTRTHTDVMVEARREAGEAAMLDVEFFVSPDFISDWSEGEDGKRYTPDDVSTSGNSTDFNSIIVHRAAQNVGDWEVLNRITGNDVSQLRGSPIPPNPNSVFGLVHGDDSDSVPIFSAVQSLLYRAESVLVKQDVWMTRLGGIY